MIASFTEGRVRLRAAALRDPEKLRQVEDTIRSQDGVLHTLANPRTGSLLVEYDPERIPRQNLFMAAELLEKELGLSREKPERRKKTVQLITPGTELMLLAGALGFSMLGGVVSKRLHVAAGALFLLAAGRHLYSRRRRFPLPRWIFAGVQRGCGCAKKAGASA